jgi:hypothetical protein
MLDVLALNIRRAAACLRLIRPMRQMSNWMTGTVRNDGTFFVGPFQTPAKVMDVPEIQKLFELRDQDADDFAGGRRSWRCAIRHRIS